MKLCTLCYDNKDMLQEVTRGITPDVCENCGLRDGWDYGRIRVRNYRGTPHPDEIRALTTLEDQVALRITQYPQVFTPKKILASGGVIPVPIGLWPVDTPKQPEPPVDIRFFLDAHPTLCTECFDANTAKVLHGRSPYACVQCGKRDTEDEKCFMYVQDPRPSGEELATQLVKNRMASRRRALEENPGQPLPLGATRHRPLPLACLTLPDAACFMKGR